MSTDQTAKICTFVNTVSTSLNNFGEAIEHKGAKFGYITE